MQTLDRAGFIRLLLTAAAEVRGQQDLLSQLDSHGGDGDHGTTMARAMSGLEGVLEKSSAGTLRALLEEIGWAVLGVDGGATGPLFGTFFLNMADAVPEGEALDGAALATLFEAGLAGVRGQTRAQVGDKTLLDALVPAVQAARQTADAGGDVTAVLEQAAEAARRGAEATAPLQAKFGRARHLGARSAGHPDPGATSVSFLFRGFFQGSKTHA